MKRLKSEFKTIIIATVLLVISLLLLLYSYFTNSFILGGVFLISSILNITTIYRANKRYSLYLLAAEHSKCYSCKKGSNKTNLVDHVPSIRYVRKEKRKNGHVYRLSMPNPDTKKYESKGIFTSIGEAYRERESILNNDPRYSFINPKGITYLPERKKYRAYLTYKNKMLQIGEFDFEDEAIKKRQEVILSLIF